MARLTTKDLPPTVAAPSKTRITISLKPYTPCMCGDYNGKHYQYTTDGKVIPTGVPTAKSIIGKMRWLARYIILASTTPGIPTLNHAEADQKYPVYKIGDKKLGLLQFLFGATSPTQWKGVVTLQLIGDDLFRTYINKDKFIDSDYLEDKNKGIFGEMANANTRFKLLALKTKEGLHPIDLENMLENPLRLYLIFDEKRLSRMKGSPACAKAFVAGLALATPLILGLGKGATRGFGRFLTRLDDDAGLREKCQLLDDLASHLGALQEDGERENIEGVFNALAGLAAQAAKVNNYKAPRIEAFIVEGKWSNVQINLKKESTLSPHVKPINRALAAIGNATLKAFWKKALGREPDEPGSDIHTWILGLPRSQRFPKNKWCPMRTGYLLGRNIGEYEVIDEDSWRDWKPQSGRYQSPIFLFPLPPSEETVKVVVLALPQCDISELLNGFEGRWLYHAGVPKLRSYIKLKSIPPCKEDLGRVESILRGVKPSQQSGVRKHLGYALPGKRAGFLNTINCDVIMGASRFFKDHVLNTILSVLEDSSI